MIPPIIEPSQISSDTWFNKSSTGINSWAFAVFIITTCFEEGAEIGVLRHLWSWCAFSLESSIVSSNWFKKSSSILIIKIFPDSSTSIVIWFPPLIFNLMFAGAIFSPVSSSSAYFI